MGFFKNLTSAIPGIVEGSAAGFNTGGPLGALAGAGAGGLMSAFSAYGANEDAEQEFKYSSALQKQQMDFYERMSNTSYQRQMADLKKAGLNPTLMFGSGASATGATTAMPGSGTSISVNRTQTALNAARQIAEVKNIEADTQKKQEETKQTKQIIEWTPALNKSMIKLQKAQTKEAQEKAKTEVAKQIALGLQSEFQTMENQVRYGVGGANITQEIEARKKQLMVELIEAGYDGSTAGAVANKVFEYLTGMTGLITGGMMAKAISTKTPSQKTQIVNGPLNIVK